jgi:hypothetical protein
VDPRRRTLAALAGIVACVLAVTAVVRATGGGDYADRVAGVCRSVDAKLHAFRGSYFDAVAMTSQARAAGLANVRPDAAHARLHAQLLATEAQLTQGARDAQQLFATAGAQAAIARFSPLRALEATQNRRYETLGIRGCAN